METLYHQMRVPSWMVSSYRTYEEWKQETVFLLCLLINRSYRTYEEWKHTIYQFSPVILVFLPYL